MSPASAATGASHAEVPSARLRDRALAVLGTRLVFTGVLLGGSLLLLPEASTFTGQALLLLIATAFGTTVGLAIALQRGAAISVVGGAQVALDLGLVTGLVYLTGGAYSGFGSLYAAVVLVAALLLGPQPTMLAAAAALLLYLGLALGLTTHWLAPPPDQVITAASTAELSVALLRNSIGLSTVGGLSVALAARLSRARGEAARATQFSDDVVRSIAAGVVTVDASGAITTANTQAAEALGGEASLVGVPVSRVLPLDAGTERARIDGTATKLDGSTFPVGLTRTPLRDADGRVRGALVLFQDLTELVMLRDKAERAERLAALGRLAAGLAHEIRNPLGSISGSVELVRDAGTLGDEDRRLLDLVLEETSRLNELVGSMLAVGRPSAPERVPVDVVALTREVLTMARTKSSVPIELSGDDVAMASADAAQLRQVLWNLIKNATQYAPKGTPVEVRVRGGAGVTIEVEDHGPGISDADRAHVFDMFFTRRTEGVGIGLALAKQIVDAHGGTIEIDSVEGRGTTFRVVLDGAP